MVERDEDRKLFSLIEADDAYLGGQHPGKRGRGSENKQPFIAAVETDSENHPLYMKFEVVDAFTKKEVKAWAERSISKESYVFTDGLNCFNGLDEANFKHVTERIGRGNKSTKILFSIGSTPCSAM